MLTLGFWVTGERTPADLRVCKSENDIIMYTPLLSECLYRSMQPRQVISVHKICTSGKLFQYIKSALVESACMI